MKKIDLDRERGYPFEIAVAHMADGQSLMLTGSCMPIHQYLEMIGQPMIVKRTVFSRTFGKRSIVQLRYPSKRIGVDCSFSIEKLSNGELARRSNRARDLYGPYTFANVSDFEKVRAREMFCLVKTTYDRQRTSTVLCALRKIPDTFPNKIREALKEHSNIEGL